MFRELIEMYRCSSTQEEQDAVVIKLQSMKFWMA